MSQAAGAECMSGEYEIDKRGCCHNGKHAKEERLRRYKGVQEPLDVHQRQHRRREQYPRKRSGDDIRHSKMNSPGILFNSACAAASASSSSGMYQRKKSMYARWYWIMCGSAATALSNATLALSSAPRRARSWPMLCHASPVLSASMVSARPRYSYSFCPSPTRWY